MKLSDISIRNPVFAWMLMASFMIFGAICFSRMGVSQLPDVDFPVASVSVALEGAAPEVMETTVVDPIEDTLMTVQGVRSLQSNSKQGNATITVEFDLDKDIDVAVQEIQTKIAQVQRLLPKEVDPPTISKTNPDDQPIIWLALQSTNPDRRYLMNYAKTVMKDQFSTVAGVGEVFLGGYVDPNLRIWVEPETLRQHNITVLDIINSIQTEHSELPGGQIETPEKNYNVRTLGEAKTVEDFENIVISQRAGSLNQNPFNSLKLKQVARIEEGLANITRTSRFNGNMALGMGIRKQKGSNAVEVARKVKEKVVALQSILPSDIKLNVNFDSTVFIEESIHELNFTLIFSAILTAFACWIFLGSWSATLNVVLAIPTSVLGAFIPLYFLGFTLNTFTLLGLSLSIGIVVDDAIMVLENIFRHREKGLSRASAAIVGAREITFAAMAATVAIIAVFLPIAFMKGIIGKFFLQFAVTISMAVFLSLIEALTITPMRSAQFLEAGERTTRIGRGFEWVMDWCRTFYAATLRQALRNRWKVVLGSLVLMVAGFGLLKIVPKEFSPAQDQSTFLVRMQTPPGSSLPFTDEKVKLVEKFLMEQPELKQVYVAIGGFGGGQGEGNTAMFFVTMKPKKERPYNEKLGRRMSQQDFMNVVRTELTKMKDVKPVIQDLSMRGFSSGRGFPIEFTVRGPDWDKLAEYSQAIMKEMESSGLMTDVDSNYLLGAPEVQITPDRKAAALYGISAQAIGQTVNSLIGGVRVGQYTKDGRRYDIRLQVNRKYEKIDEIPKLVVGNTRSNLVPLSQVVTREVRPSLQQISRIDRQRAISVYSNLKTAGTQEKALARIQEISKKILPDGYVLAMSGSSQTFKESFQSLIFALVMGLLVAYMVLASQFNSFIDPITVLIALPFAIGGAFAALLVTGQSLNIYSMIGVVLLMGLVKKNSIMLVEFANSYRSQHRAGVLESLLEACPVRLRPILMTSFATIAGAMPPALALGPGAETVRPMAITIIGGTFVSTLLTLYVVPCVYSLLSKLERKQEASQEVIQAFELADQTIAMEAKAQKDFNSIKGDQLQYHGP